MEIIGKEKVASVELTQIKVSEDELAVYEAALSYAMKALEAAEVERRFGASVDEVEAMRDDLRHALAQRESPHRTRPCVGEERADFGLLVDGVRNPRSVFLSSPCCSALR
ncbi:MAG: hypothetical protein ACR2LZ_13785 [Pyrinomonadaceae bacterium]